MIIQGNSYKVGEAHIVDLGTIPGSVIKGHFDGVGFHVAL